MWTGRTVDTTDCKIYNDKYRLKLLDKNDRRIITEFGRSHGERYEKTKPSVEK